IKGLSEQDARRIIAARGQPYTSVRDLWLRTGLSPRIIERLADADAFGSLGLSRRQALWAAKALGRVGEREDDLPLFRARPKTGRADSNNAINLPLDRANAHEGFGEDCQSSYLPEPEVTLPLMPLGEEVVHDYRFLELSLRVHPASFLRNDLTG